MCLLIATRAACVNDEIQIISQSATTPATTGVAISPVTLTLAANTKPLYTYTISNYSGFSTTTTSIIKNYPIPAGKTELTLYVQFIPDASPTADTLKYILNIGGVEYPVVSIPTTANALATPYLRQVTLHVPAGTTNLPVNVTFVTLSSSGTINTKILSGVYYFNRVIDNNNACGSTCQEVAGKTTGVTIATNPPVCIYCSNDLF